MAQPPEDEDDLYDGYHQSDLDDGPFCEICGCELPVGSDDELCAECLDEERALEDELDERTAPDDQPKVRGLRPH